LSCGRNEANVRSMGWGVLVYLGCANKAETISPRPPTAEERLEVRPYGLVRGGGACKTRSAVRAQPSYRLIA
jgi:hypothetical protein